MPSLKIATWNVNSLRVRLNHLLSWLKTAKPDVLAIQELKCEEPLFPYDVLLEAGYESCVSAQKTYNGVAILSKKKAEDVVTDIKGFIDPQKRVLGATIDNVRILNLYVPNGESITSAKYQYKLDWLQNLNKFIQNESKNYRKMIILGDFNIAPTDLDVHDPTLWQGRVLCSDSERDAFKALLSAGFSDCYRTLAPTDKHFTWWDYRMNSYKRNIGARIDHILMSENMMTCQNCYIDQSPRSWERPSDHAPIVAEFGL